MDKDKVIKDLNYYIETEVKDFFLVSDWRLVTTAFFEQQSVIDLYKNTIFNLLQKHKITKKIIQQLKDNIDSELDFLTEVSEYIILSEVLGFCDNYIVNSDLERRIKEMLEN